VLWSAAITSVVGCSYTSLSFVPRLRAAGPGRRVALVAFIGASLALYLLLGRPVRLLIVAGAVNGLILPLTLGVVLLAARRRDLMGRYRHPAALQAAGWGAWAVSVVAGALAVSHLARRGAPAAAPDSGAPDGASTCPERMQQTATRVNIAVPVS